MKKSVEMQIAEKKALSQVAKFYEKPLGRVESLNCCLDVFRFHSYKASNIPSICAICRHHNCHVAHSRTTDGAWDEEPLREINAKVFYSGSKSPKKPLHYCGYFEELQYLKDEKPLVWINLSRGQVEIESVNEKRRREKNSV